MASLITCKRCEGKGRLAHFGYVNNGVCLSCRGRGQVVKTKRVTTVETHYTAVTFNGSQVHCGTDRARAEALHAEWTAQNCQGEILVREVKKTVQVAV